MLKIAAPHTRPYWFVDAKWITGILLFFALCATLVVFSLFKLTEKQTAVNMLTYATAAGFSRNGLDNESEIAQIRELLNQSPTGSVQLIPDNPSFTVSKQDLEGKTPREIRLTIFGRVAESIYEQGGQDMQKLGAAALLTKKSHESLRPILFVTSAASLLLAALMVFFSHRFGRFLSPGIVLTMASLPGFLVSRAGQEYMSQHPPAPAPPGDGDLTAQASFILQHALPFAIPPVLQVFSTALLVGVSLIAIAIIGRLAFFVVRKVKK